ncbi:17753_t:CDS:1, partial [Acaulospora morrowiae]
HTIALQKKFTNTKCACAKHLENCQYWAKRYTQEQTQEIIQKAMEHGSKKFNKWLRTTYNNQNEEDLTDLSETSTLHQNFGLLDNYTYHELKFDQVEMFEKLLLDATVACG